MCPSPDCPSSLLISRSACFLSKCHLILCDGCDRISKECGFGLLLYYWHLLHLFIISPHHFLAFSPQMGNTVATRWGYMAVEMLLKEYIFICIAKSRRKPSSPRFLASGGGESSHGLALQPSGLGWDPNFATWPSEVQMCD